MKEKYRYTKNTTDNAFEKAERVVQHLNLQYNFRCVKYLLDVENIGIGQLRTAQFFNGKDYYLDFNRSAYLLVKAGLIGSKQFTTESATLEDRIYEILDNWQELFGSLLSLHILLIKQLDERHFFIESAAVENLQKSLMNSTPFISDLLKKLTAQTEQEETILATMRKHAISEMHTPIF